MIYIGQFLLLIAGLAFIIVSAEYLIDAASKIAHKMGVSLFVVGITVVAFGTSMPEFVVGLVSAINKTNELSLGNVIGAIIFNFAFVMGVSTLIAPLVIKRSVMKKEYPILLFVLAGLAYLMFEDGILGRSDGIILLVGFVLFIAYIIFDTKNDKAEHEKSGLSGFEEQEMLAKLKKDSYVKLFLIVAVSVFGLFIGGKLTEYSSTKISEMMGLSQTIIGLTVISIATTLPELIASVAATRKREHEIVLGNCIGSILFNILLVLGSSSLITPIAVNSGLVFDFIVACAVALFVFFVSLRRRELPKSLGITLITVLTIYLISKVLAA